MTKEDNEDFKNSTKCWIYDFVDNDVKVKEIIVILLKNIEALRTGIVISMLN